MFTRNYQKKERERDLISNGISQNKQILCKQFEQIPDLVIRDIGTDYLLAFVDGLTDNQMLSENVIKPLLKHSSSVSNDHIHSILAAGNITTSRSWDQVSDALLHGNSILFVEGRTEAYLLSTAGWKERSIKEPQNESTLLGSHQGFVETGKTNIALIRRYLPDKELKIIEQEVGIRGRTKVSLLYLRDVANPEIVNELNQRVQNIRVDALINTGELQEFVEDNSFTVFPQFLLSERPDSTASELLQGRIALVFDRSPSVLIGPYSLASFFQSVDDYSMRWIMGTFVRILRYLAFVIAVFLPSFYIAIVSFHFEILPLDLIISVGESRIKVPLTPIMEAFLMEITIEMLREAGIRLPSPVGQTVGVVGGIIIGQAAVQAGIVSNIMIIIVALTAIASFMLPNQDFSSGIRLIRFPMMFMAAAFGMVGIVIGTMILLAHLISLKSLGMPYGSPFAPVRFQDWKDSFIRVPMPWMNTRPVQNRPKQLKRQGSGEGNSE